MGQEVSAIIKSGMSKEELIYEYASIYLMNPEMWDRIISKTLQNASNYEIPQEIVIEEEYQQPERLYYDPNVQRFSKEIIQEINYVRQQPQNYIPFLYNRLEKFKDEFIYKLSDDSDSYLKSKEGKKAIIQLIEQLKITEALSPMTISSYLEVAAMDHGSDISQNNIFSHTSSNGASIKDRVERYCLWRGSLGENMDFGSNNARDIVINLLIDDGVPSRGHRKNILSPDYKVLGAAIGPHSMFQYCCVINFSCKIIGKDQIMRRDIKKSINSLPQLANDKDVARIINSVPYSGDLYAECREEILNGTSIIIEFYYSKKQIKLSFVKDKKTVSRGMSWSN